MSQTIQVVHNPSQDVIDQAKSWPTWGCGVSKFPWTYDDNETAYVLKGEVIVTPDGGKPVTIKAGDLVVFPGGMSCTWDVKQAIEKHYSFQ